MLNFISKVNQELLLYVLNLIHRNPLPLPGAMFINIIVCGKFKFSLQKCKNAQPSQTEYVLL